MNGAPVFSKRSLGRSRSNSCPPKILRARGRSAVVAFGEHVVGKKVPSLRFTEHYGDAIGSPHDVVLSTSSALMPPLRGATIPDINASVAPSLSAQPGDEVLASVEDRALWTVNRASGSPAHTASVAPREVGAGDSLRDQLKESDFVVLLPLVHLLREMADFVWPRPPLRATFVIDDPNLHSSSYRLPRLRRSRGARERDRLPRVDRHGSVRPVVRAWQHGAHLPIKLAPFCRWRFMGTTTRAKS